MNWYRWPRLAHLIHILRREWRWWAGRWTDKPVVSKGWVPPDAP